MILQKIFKLFQRILYRTRPEQNGRVVVTGRVSGVNQVNFEGNNAVLQYSNFNGNVQVGYATTFSTNCFIHGDITIGKYCQFGPFASINTFNHPINHMSTYINKRLLNGLLSKYKTSAKTQIGNDVWVGKNAIILGGVTIGNGAIIAAGAVVTSDVPPYSVYAGVPAKHIKDRFSPTVVAELEALAWWDKTKSELEAISALFEKDLTQVTSIYE